MCEIGISGNHIFFGPETVVWYIKLYEAQSGEIYYKTILTVHIKNKKYLTISFHSKPLSRYYKI